MHAFIATVPFTILEAVTYVIGYDLKEADLYLVKVFKNAEEVGQRIRATHIFKNVYVVEDVLLTYPITVKKCVNVVKNSRSILKLMKRHRYECIYYNNSGWLINSIFYTGALKGNKQVKNIFLEHGYYSYTNDYADKSWKLRLLIRMVGLKCMDGSMIDEFYAFHPELIDVRYDGELKKMPNIDKNNSRLVNAVNEIFGYDREQDEFLSKDIIVLEQGPQKFEFDKDAFWKKVFQVIDRDRTIIKPHPRQKESTLYDMGASICKNHTTPWEVEIMNIDADSKYQITIFSSSCVSPKLLFDEEPTVILLFKLLPVDMSVWDQKLLDFSEKLGNQYRTKERYFVPETFEEFEQYCMNHGITKLEK